MVDRALHGASDREPLLRSNDGSTADAGADDHEAVGDDVSVSQDTERKETSDIGFAPKLCATMFDFFTSGCAMAAVGALIPDIEAHYGSSDATTAFIFPAGVFGYLLATATVQKVHSRFGQRGIAVLSPCMRLLASLVLAASPPFGILLVAYAFFGYGTGLTDTAWNTWASSMRRPNVVQGLLHGSFSLGCVVGPVLAVAILREHTWNRFYLVLVILSFIELITQGLAFRHDSALPQKPSSSVAEEHVIKLRDLIQNRSVWLCCLFYFAYQGVEATFTDWIVVYMQRTRNANPSVAGLASSVFWIGMTVGRYALGPVSERFGVAGSVAVYILFGLGFQIALNLISGVTGTVVLLGAVGFFVAPLFPSGIVLLVSRLQPQAGMTAVALLIALGQVGAAVAPLAVGFMATSFGIQHLFKVVCGFSVLMLLLWILFVKAK